MIHAPIHPSIDDRSRHAGVDDVLDGLVATMDALELVALPGTVDASDTERREWTWYRESDAAEACIARFARCEADVMSDDISGLGRVSGARCPRLGGVLHGKVAPGSIAATTLTTAAERTIRAGYRAAIATAQVSQVPVLHVDFDELWDAFVPASYRIPRNLASLAWDVCRFDRFWEIQLAELGLERDAARFAKGLSSPLSRSIRGLSTVGLSLAVAERGGRPERLRGHRNHAARAMRLPRPASVLREVPPMPRPVATPSD
jgi:hypothetical protein